MMCPPLDRAIRLFSAHHPTRFDLTENSAAPAILATTAKP